MKQNNVLAGNKYYVTILVVVLLFTHRYMFLYLMAFYLCLYNKNTFYN